MTGAADLGNGVAVMNGSSANLVGGLAVADRNVISGNGSQGVQLDGVGTSTNTVQGNYIGTNATATLPLGNTIGGVRISGGATANTIGGSTPTARNVISGNPDGGIELRTGVSGNIIQGNFIGTDVTGAAPLANTTGIEIRVAASSNIIGGPAVSARNVIAFNSGDGISFASDASSGTSILGNSIHSNGDLAIDFNNDGVTPNDPGDGDAGPNDLLNFPEITLATAAVGNITIDFDLDVPAGDYRVEIFANPIGADPSGYGEGQSFTAATAITHTGSGTETFTTTALGAVGDIVTATVTEQSAGPVYGSTSEFALAVTAVPPTLVVVNSTGDLGDATPGDDSCDTGGLNSEGDTECTLRAAIDEANASATIATIEFNMPTTEPGYSVAPLSWTIAPLATYDDIVATVTIDATTQPGYTSNPIVELDGTNAGAATAALTLEADNSLIEGFVVHTWADEGLEIDGSTGAGDNNILRNNWVGFDAGGATLGIADVGILVTVGATGNTIEGNIVGGAANGGVVIRNTGSDANIVVGNQIGVAPDGSTPNGNGSHGVHIYDLASSNRIGGPGAGEANLIANNVGDGVYIDSNAGTGNTALSNSIISNGGLGIDLGADGVTFNDAGDADAGPNDLLNFPDITGASESGGTVTVDFELDVPAGDYRIELFSNSSGADPSGYGEGEGFAGSTMITHTGFGVEPFSASVPGAVGDIITATATEQSAGPVYGSTSEFSLAVTAVTPTIVVVNSTGDLGDTAPGNDSCDTGALNSEGATECTLRAAIEEANASATIATINFAIPPSDPNHIAGVWTIAVATALPAASATVDIDGFTQSGSSPNTAGSFTAGDEVLALELDGPGAASGAYGFHLSADNSSVRGFAIYDFSRGVYVTGNNNTVAGNHVGTNAAGDTALSTGWGVSLGGTATSTVIGGSAPADRNVISGNTGTNGIDIRGAGVTATTVENNFIGTTPSGTTALANLTGIVIVGSAGNTIGPDNLISGNSDNGLYIDADGNEVVGNRIGTDVDGSVAMANVDDGIEIRGASNSVGGAGAGDGNLISGNGDDGIVINLDSADNNVVSGNWIGTD